MARMKRSIRLLDEYDLHVTQLIRAKLIVPKSKNLDKAHGGKKPRYGGPNGSQNTNVVLGRGILLYHNPSIKTHGPFKRPAPLIDMKRRANAMLIEIDAWENFFQYQNSFKGWTKNILPGILATFVASKKKVRKRSRPIDAAPLAQDSSREKFSTIGADEGYPIDIPPNEANNCFLNSGSNLVEQLRTQGSWLFAHGDALIGSKAENIPLQKLFSSEPPHACVGYAYNMDNEHKKVVKLPKKLNAVEDRVVAKED
uniref:Uncharacterized protein n=1 Tax=Cannabis sativa TaxID=3483 RepID=A0A803P9W3_CANSA